MTTQPSTVDLGLTAQQLNVLLDALYDKSLETDRYLSGCLDGETPGPLDTCCDAHMARYKERRAQRDTLVERKKQTHALIDLIQGAVSAVATPTTVNTECVTLVSGDKNDVAHRQPLSDAVPAGTVIDPEPGDDLKIAATVVAIPAGRDDDIIRKLADALRDHENDKSLWAAEWIVEHQNADEVWNLIDELLDQFVSMANGEGNQPA